MPYQWKVLPFGLATAPRVFTSLTNLYCSFAVTMVCILLSIWMTSWSLFTLSGWVRGHACFVSLLVHLGLHINFSKFDLHLSQTFCFFGLCWDTVHMSASLPPDKLADIQQLALSFLQATC